MTDFNLSLIFLFGFFLLKTIWAITDPRPVSERIREILSPRLIVYAVLALTVFWPLFFGQALLEWPETTWDGYFIYLGVGLFWVGLLLSFWAKLSMKTFWGVPAQHEINRQSQLVTSGPFKVTRNPIYVGLLLVILGVFLAYRSYLIFTMIIWTFYVYKATLVEESLLEKYFGKEYLNYKQKVRRFI